MKFFVGLIVGLLGLGGYVGYEKYRAQADPCMAHCGEGTHCVEGICLVLEAAPAVTGKKKRKRRRRRRRKRKTGDSVAALDEPALRKPTAADVRPARKGPSLKGTDFVDMAEAGGRELSESEVDTRFRKLDRRIVGCIDKARDDYDLDRGKVVVGFRIERTGAIKKVRVTAPSLLLRNGIYPCIKGLVTGLRFPRSSRSLVMSYPYGLH